MVSQEGHDPREGPEELTRSEFECNEENRLLGYRIWFRVRVEGASLLEAWRAVFPNSDASDESAAERKRATQQRGPNAPVSRRRSDGGPDTTTTE